MRFLIVGGSEQHKFSKDVSPETAKKKQILAFSKVETQSDLALKMDMTVTCAHCTLELPLRGVEYSAGSTPSSRKIHGNIRQLNMALRKIVYKPAWAVGYNTQSVSTTAR
jgi:hypothetical protein